jgi:hypothetical protein
MENSQGSKFQRVGAQQLQMTQSILKENTLDGDDIKKFSVTLYD